MTDPDAFRRALEGSAPADPERLPPVNFEAEQALLGAILANNAAFDVVSEVVQPEHFADPVNGEIYAACRDLIERGTKADALTLRSRFEKRPELQDVGGGHAYLATLQANYVSIANARDYAETLVDLALRRQLIALSEEMSERAWGSSDKHDARRQIEEHEQRLSLLGATGIAGTEPRALGRLVDEVLTEAEDRRHGGAQLLGYPSGLACLDRKTAGLIPGDFGVIAGRPSMGKSAVGANIARAVAEAGRTAAYFSLEMTAKQLAARYVAPEAGVSGLDLRRGKYDDEQADALMERGRPALLDLPLYIDDTPALTMGQIQARARLIQRKHGLAVVVIDHLGLVRPSAEDQRYGSKVQEMSGITAACKVMAKRLGVFVLGLHQLSRAVEGREDKRPRLADLRDSGSFEQDADWIGLLYREAYYLERNSPAKREREAEADYQVRVDEWRARLEKIWHMGELDLAKQREGEIGAMMLRWDARATRYVDPGDDGQERMEI